MTLTHLQSPFPGSGGARVAVSLKRQLNGLLFPEDKRTLKKKQTTSFDEDGNWRSSM